MFCYSKCTHIGQKYCHPRSSESNGVLCSSNKDIMAKNYLNGLEYICSLVLKLSRLYYVMHQVFLMLIAVSVRIRAGATVFLSCVCITITVWYWHTYICNFSLWSWDKSGPYVAVIPDMWRDVGSYQQMLGLVHDKRQRVKHGCLSEFGCWH